MKKYLISSTMVLAALSLSGCMARQFAAGISQGQEDYQKVRAGDFIGAKRAGYLIGVAIELDKDSKSGNLKELEEGIKRIQKRLEKLDR